MSRIYKCPIPQHQHQFKIQQQRCSKKHKLQALRSSHSKKGSQLTPTKQSTKASEQTMSTSKQTSSMGHESKPSPWWLDFSTMSPGVLIEISDSDEDDDGEEAQYHETLNLLKQPANHPTILQFDNDDEWRPIQIGRKTNWQYHVYDRQPKKNWRQAQKQEIELLPIQEDVEKEALQRKELKQTDKFYRRIRRANTGRAKTARPNTKKFMGEFLTKNPAHLMFYDLDWLLNFLPTQVPDLNLEKRFQIQQAYMLLEEMLIDHYLCKNQDFFDCKSKTNRETMMNLRRDMKVLIDVLNRNIYDPKRVWKFHFDAMRKQVESYMAQVWIYVKDLPDAGSLPQYPDKNLTFFREEMGKFVYRWREGVLQDRVPIGYENWIDEQSSEYLNMILDRHINPPIQPINVDPTESRVVISNSKKKPKKPKTPRKDFRQLGGTKYQTTPCETPQEKQFRRQAREAMEEKQVAIEKLRKEIFKKLRQGLPPISRVYLGYGIAHIKFYYRPINAIRLYENFYDLITDINPRCPKCRDAMKIMSNIVTGCMDYFCATCRRPWAPGWKKRWVCPEYKTLIECRGPTNKSKYKSIPRTEVKNNFHFYTKGARRAKYSDEVPYKMRTNIPHFSEETCRSIQFNREEESYLPLEISSSIIKGAGLGVKVLTDVAEGTILLSYVGMIKTHYEILAGSADAYSIGVVNTTPDPTALLIDPSEYGNAGRFINTAEKSCMNCRPQIGMFTPTDELPEPAVIIVSTKKIPAGHELFYNYGSDYGKFV